MQEDDLAGPLVCEVVSGGGAERAGIVVGWRIRRVNGVEVTSNSCQATSNSCQAAQ
jgi:C-terminal processing protease CtpA/Prc